LPGIHPRRRPALELVQRPHDSDHGLDQRPGGSGVHRPHLARGQPDRRSARLKDRNFALGCFFSFVTGIGLFATIYLTPLFLGRVRGYGALDIGLAVFSTGVFQIMAIPLYAFLANRIDLRWIMMPALGCSPCRCGISVRSPTTGGRELMLPQACAGLPSNWRCRRSDFDPGRLGTGATETCFGAVQPDAQPGRRDRHRRLCDHSQ
jgi:hypothetical protein